MPETENVHKEVKEKKKKSLAVKILKIFAWIVGSVIFLVILVLLLIQLPSVQNFGRKKVVTFLNQKLQTHVEIGKLSIRFPTALSLQDVYFEDQSKDTLLYGKELAVDIKMLQLLRNNIEIEEIYLDGIVAKIKRLPPDSTFNFQYIVDAFSSENQKEPENQDSSTLKIDIDRLLVENTHVIYDDAYTGNDLDLTIGKLDTHIDQFDPMRLYFEVPTIELANVSGHFYQSEPMKKSVEKAVAEASAEEETVFQFHNEEILLSNIDVDFKSEPAKINSGIQIGKLVVHPQTIDLENYVIRIKDIALENANLLAQIESSNTQPMAADTTVTVPTPDLRLYVGQVNIRNTNVQYDDLLAPRAPRGMDFAHLNIRDFNLNVSDIFYTTDTVQARVNAGSFKEKSGFELTEFKTDFSMLPNGISLEDLLVKTPHTTIQKYAVITYPSLEALGTNPGTMGLDIDLTGTRIDLRDVHTLMPDLELPVVPTSPLYVDAVLQGKVSNLDIERLYLRGLSATDIQVNGKIKGLPETDQLFADLNIERFNTSRSDLFSLAPAGSIPSTITIPQHIRVYGDVRGSMNSLYTNLTVNTTLGGAQVTGTLGNITDETRASYNMQVKARNLQVGTIIQSDQIGSLTADLKVKGRGLDPQTATAVFDAVVSDITLKGYHYRDFAAAGSIRDQVFEANAAIHDPNIDITLEAAGTFESQFPSIQLTASIDSIKTKPLHLTTSDMMYHGNIDANFTSTNPDSLNGDLFVTQTVFVNDGKRITIDTLSLVAVHAADTQSIALQADFLQAVIAGEYTLTELGSVFTRSINPYFTIDDSLRADTLQPYRFTLDASVVETPTITTFLPDLTTLDPITLRGQFASDSGFNLALKAPLIEYGTNTIRNVLLSAGTRNDSLAIRLGADEIKSGESIALFNPSVSGNLKNDILDFLVNIQDPKKQDKFVLGGQLRQQNNPSGYLISLKPGSIILDYDNWQVNENNQLSYIEGDIHANDFVLSNDGQQLSIQSTQPGRGSPLEVDFKDFRISTIMSLVQQDSFMVNGLINGNAVVENLQESPVFVTDLSVKDLSMYGDTLGNLTARVNNRTANVYNADVTLTGFGNDIQIGGDYRVSDNSSFDITASINRFQMSALEGITNGAIRDARGHIYGKVDVTGTMKEPNVDGRIQFENTAFNVSMLNNVFKIDEEAVAIISNKGVTFDYFSIRDTANNALTLDGAVLTDDFRNYSFDMNIRADEFQALNSTNKDNDLFYGRFVFSTRLNITGTPSQPKVDGSLTIEDKTDFTFVLPQDEPGIVQREGIVRFVDYNAGEADSIFISNREKYDSLNTAPISGFDIAVNVSVKKDATFNVIVDQGNGDFLRLKGTAELNVGMDPSGKINMTGSYEIEEGGYNLTFNFLKRDFEIQKGSRIVWTGEPTSAQVDITAVYVANTAPLDLVKDQITTNENLFKQKLPFRVELKMAGELLQPRLTFDIVLPEDENYGVSSDIVNTVRTKLTQIRQQESELNKQVFALLLLGRFVGENPFDNSSSEGFSAESFAKQSVSRLLSEQLNKLAEGLIEGVDINFDLATTQDYTTGQREDRTDLNIGVSKRLLNDRLTVTVGSNFELEGPRQSNQNNTNLAGNININYALSKDGRYAIRAYRKNDYTGTIEGYVIETGIGFTINLDYNQFSEIFQSKETRRKMREIKRKNKELRKENERQRLEDKTITVPSKARQEDEEDQ